MDYTEYLKAQDDIRELKSARARCWASWVFTLGAGVFGSVFRSYQLKNWKPTMIATAVAVPCLGLATIDSGLTFTLLPPLTAGAAFTMNTQTARKKLQFITPEQADAALFEKQGLL